MRAPGHGRFPRRLAASHAVPVPVFGAYATPSGLVPRETFAAIRDHLLARLRAVEPFEALLLGLHGALVVEEEDDPEQVLCREIRSYVGDRPVVIVTDLHANMTAGRLATLDAFVGYRTNPHVDTYETGVDGARLLDLRVRDGMRPVMAHARVPVLAAPIAQRTADLPLLRLLHRARELERSHRLLDVTVHGGYAYADVPCRLVVHRNRAGQHRMRRGCRRGARADGMGPSATSSASTCSTLRQRSPRPPLARGRFAIADTGDIGGGAHGDNVRLLREALGRADVTTAVTVCDPEAVASAERAGVGAEVRLQVGGRSDALVGDPPCRSTRGSAGLVMGRSTTAVPRARVSMGRAATVRAGTVDVVLQSQPIQPNDPELFRCAEAEPTRYDVVILKGASALRAGWTDLVSGFVDAGTPGATDCNLARLPYRRLVDNVWPLAEVEDVEPTVPRTPGAAWADVP